MKLWEFAVFIKQGLGIHLLLHNVNKGAGFGALIYIELPKISVSLKILTVDLILTIGNITEEISAAKQRKGKNEPGKNS